MTRQDYRPADTQVLEARATEYLERIRSASAVDGAPGSKETEENPEAEGDKARSGLRGGHPVPIADKLERPYAAGSQMRTRQCFCCSPPMGV